MENTHGGYGHREMTKIVWPYHEVVIHNACKEVSMLVSA